MSELCMNCGVNVAQKYTRAVGEKQVTVTLCPECFAHLYPENENVFALFLQNVKGEGRCPSCGTTLDDLRRTGLVGCGDCYKTFRPAITPALSYIQWDTYHAGKTQSANVEEKYDAIRTLLEERDEVREQIAFAFKHKRYGEVKELEKKLKRLNDAIKAGGGI